jgi:hypothetical protein
MSVSFHVEAVRLAHSCYPRQFYSCSWFNASQRHVQEVQRRRAQEDQEAADAERKPFLEELKDELENLKAAVGKGHGDLLKYIYATYKPDGVSEVPEGTNAKVALKTCTTFHPDKCATESRKTKILYEEITKSLTNIINQQKGM